MATPNSQVAAKKPRGPGRRWKPGQSGNPNGRPKISEEYKRAISQLSPMAGQALGEIIADPSHKDRFRASEYVWNRNHGTPTVRTEISGPDGTPIAVKTVLTSDERRARAAALMAEARSRAAGSPDASGSSD